MNNLQDIEIKYKRIIDRLKGRKLTIKESMNFKKPEYLSYLNTAIKSIEKRKGKNYSIKDYKKIIIKFSQNEEFLNNCEIYEDNMERCTKPTVTFDKDIKNKYNVDNLKPSRLKNKEYYKSKTNNDEIYNLYLKMKNAPSYEFLNQFKDVEKLKFLISEIKGIDFDSAQKEEYISKFYNQRRFNVLYMKWTNNNNNKHLKPTLSYLKPIKKGGKVNDIENILFLSRLENKLKGDMKMSEFIKIKNNLKYFISGI